MLSSSYRRAAVLLDTRDTQWFALAIVLIMRRQALPALTPAWLPVGWGREGHWKTVGEAKRNGLISDL
jgi:hypothetical protein